MHLPVGWHTILSSRPVHELFLFMNFEVTADFHLFLPDCRCSVPEFEDVSAFFSRHKISYAGITCH